MATNPSLGAAAPLGTLFKNIVNIIIAQLPKFQYEYVLLALYRNSFEGKKEI